MNNERKVHFSNRMHLYSNMMAGKRSFFFVSRFTDILFIRPNLIVRLHVLLLLFDAYYVCMCALDK